MAGTKKIEYKGHQWHDTCFHCKVSQCRADSTVNITRISHYSTTFLFVLQVCATKVGLKSFIIPNEKDIYCVSCFEDRVATKCTKCKQVVQLSCSVVTDIVDQVLTSGGVTFRGEPWHKECFVCAHCGLALAGQVRDSPFMSGNKLCCAEVRQPGGQTLLCHLLRGTLRQAVPFLYSAKLLL